MTVGAAPTRFTPPRRFDNGAEWLRALGGVPLERVIFDPWPGTATEGDLLLFVERDKRLCELIDGTMVEKPVGYWEGVIAIHLAAMLHAFVTPRNLGSVSGADSTMRMKSGRVRLPDVAFISMARLPTTYDAIPSLAPDLAVEILSPANTRDEIAQKLREFFESGTRLAWAVDWRKRSVAVYHDAGEPVVVIDETGHLDGEHVLPGFTMPVADLFRNVPSVA